MDQVSPPQQSPAQELFDDPERLVELALCSFREAVSEALAENDRLGITSYGAENGVIVERKPNLKPSS